MIALAIFAILLWTGKICGTDYDCYFGCILLALSFPHELNLIRRIIRGE